MSKLYPRALGFITKVVKLFEPFTVNETIAADSTRAPLQNIEKLDGNFDAMEKSLKNNGKFRLDLSDVKTMTLSGNLTGDSVATYAPNPAIQRHRIADFSYHLNDWSCIVSALFHLNKLSFH